jgi:hypothetical protein
MVLLAARLGNDGKMFSAFSGKVESGFPSETATKKAAGAFQCFRETMKCSRKERHTA